MVTDSRRKDVVVVIGGFDALVTRLGIFSGSGSGPAGVCTTIVLITISL